MDKYDELYRKIVVEGGYKIRFDDVRYFLEKTGFGLRVKNGDHFKYSMDGIVEFINIQPTVVNLSVSPCATKVMSMEISYFLAWYQVAFAYFSAQQKLEDLSRSLKLTTVVPEQVYSTTSSPLLSNFFLPSSSPCSSPCWTVTDNTLKSYEPYRKDLTKTIAHDILRMVREEGISGHN